MSNNLIGATLATFTVTLSAAVTEPVDVAWSTRDGTAKAGTDYEAANGVVTFLPGETAKQVQVTVYGQEDLTAPDKNFFIELSPPTNAVLGVTFIEVVITIDEEDGVAVLSLVVPQGKRGPKGDPGLSAYEHAVLMGYDGTVEQWMEEGASAARAAERAEGFAADAADSVAQIPMVVDQAVSDATAQAEGFAEAAAGSAEISTQKATEATAAVASTKQYVDGALSDLSTAANKFYPTLAEANADIANIVVNQPVTIGEAANGGLWYKSTTGATSLTKSAYDPLTQAKADATTKADAAKSEAIATAATDATTKANAAEINAKNYTDSSIDNVEADVAGKISTNPANDDLLQLKDANDDDYARFDRDGNLYLANMGRESLQMELKKLPELDDKNSDLINILDADGNLIIRQDADGYLYLPNMKDSLQVAIANRATGEGEFVNSDKIYDRLLFSDEVMPYLNHLLISRNTFAAPFYGLLPTNYTVDDSIISNFRADVSPNHIPINTVYRVDDDVIHPCVVEAVGTIRGYKYIMGITGYLNVREENPIVFGSNDLESFEMLTDFVQPLGLPEDTGHLSDVGFCYDPTTGDFICFWRCGFKLDSDDDGSGRNSLRYRRTKDLTNWEDEVEFFPPIAPNIDYLLSPTIVFHPSEKRWYMWSVNTWSGEIRLRKADTLEGLAAVPYERILNAGAAMPWHIEVKWVGNKFMMLLFNNNANHLFLGISDDGASWVFSQTPIFTTNPLEFYKSSFVASFNDNGDLELDILYSQGKKVHHSKTNALNINGV